MKRARWWSLVLVAVALSCVPRVSLFRPKREVRADVIGVVLPLSGKLQRVGEALRDGVTLALAGSRVKVVFRDSRGEPEGAAQAVEELAMAEGVVAILGGAVGDEATAAARRADQLWVPLLSFSKSPDVTRVGSYVFQNMPTLRSQAEAIADYSACALGQRRYAILLPETDYGRELADAFQVAVEKHGAAVTRRLTYAADKVSFIAEAQQLAGRADLEKRADYLEQQRVIFREEKDEFRRRKALERVRKALPAQVDVDALFIADGWKAVSLIAPALAFEEVVTNACNTTHRSASSSLTLLGWGGWSSPPGPDGTPELLARAQKHVECAAYSDPFFFGSTRAATRRFVDRFRAAHGGQTPNLLNAVGYDSGLMFRQVVEQAVPDSPEFRDSLANIANFDGATGVTTFDSERVAKRSLFIVRVAAEGLKEAPPARGCESANREHAAR